MHSTKQNVVVVPAGPRGTGSILARLRETDPGLHMRVVTHPTNRGYGAALASAFDAATADLVLMLDVDGQFDIAEVVRLLAVMDDETDLAIGYQARRGDPPMPLLNAWAGSSSLTA